MTQEIRRDNQTVQEIFEQYKTYQEFHVEEIVLRYDSMRERCEKLETELEFKRVHIK